MGLELDGFYPIVGSIVNKQLRIVSQSAIAIALKLQRGLNIVGITATAQEIPTLAM